jgi:formate dehydrogenase major subunit
MVWMPFCNVKATTNLLTNPSLEPFGKIPEFKSCAARVERAGLT